jgi:hypothetical protein
MKPCEIIHQNCLIGMVIMKITWINDQAASASVSRYMKYSCSAEGRSVGYSASNPNRHRKYNRTCRNTENLENRIVTGSLTSVARHKRMFKH